MSIAKHSVAEEPSRAFVGTHVIADLFDVPAVLLNDARLMTETIKLGVEHSGAHLCTLNVKEFSPHGITILALLSESHASIHTYPEKSSLFVDAFTCGTRCRPERIVEALVSFLQPGRVQMRVINRGENDGQ